MLHAAGVACVDPLCMKIKEKKGNKALWKGRGKRQNPLEICSNSFENFQIHQPYMHIVPIIIC